MILPHFSFSDTFSVDDKFYFGFGAGVINPNDVDIDITVAETINGVAFSGNINGEFKFDVGYQISTVLGYRLSDSLSIEGEFGYLNFDYDSVNLTAGGTATSGGVTFTGSANTSYVIDGNIDSYSFLFLDQILILILATNLNFNWWRYWLFFIAMKSKVLEGQQGFHMMRMKLTYC